MEAWGWLCEGMSFRPVFRAVSMGLRGLSVKCSWSVYMEDPQLCSQNSQEQARCGSVLWYHRTAGVAGGGGIGRVPWAYWSWCFLGQWERPCLKKKVVGEAGIAPEESTNMNTQVLSNEHKSIAHTHREYESGRGLSHLRLECEPDIVAHLIL